MFNKRKLKLLLRTETQLKINLTRLNNLLKDPQLTDEKQILQINQLIKKHEELINKIETQKGVIENGN